MKTVLLTLLFLTNFATASETNSRFDNTLLNIATTLEKSLDTFSKTCSKKVQFSNQKSTRSAKTFNQPSPFPMPIDSAEASRQKRLVRRPINSPLPMPIESPNKSVQKRRFSQKPFFTSQADQCVWERSMISEKLIQEVEKEIEISDLNRSEFDYALEFIFNIAENMNKEQNAEVLSKILSSKRLYFGLELVKVIVENGLVPPKTILKTDLFFNSFVQNI